jgi:hypothetical protein
MAEFKLKNIKTSYGSGFRMDGINQQYFHLIMVFTEDKLFFLE